MFEPIKIERQCKKFLKKYKIPYNDEFHIYKKFGFIYCKVPDWREYVEIEGFPVLTINEAVKILILSCLFEYFVKEEAEKRTQLKKDYPREFGKYDGRKYLFEKILSTYKKYDEADYKKQIIKYTKYINKNRDGQKEWVYDYNIELFVREKDD